MERDDNPFSALSASCAQVFNPSLFWKILMKMLHDELHIHHSANLFSIHPVLRKHILLYNPNQHIPCRHTPGQSIDHYAANPPYDTDINLSMQTMDRYGRMGRTNNRAMQLRQTWVLTIHFFLFSVGCIMAHSFLSLRYCQFVATQTPRVVVW